MAYALALSKSSMTSQAITKLKSIATVDGKRVTVFGSSFYLFTEVCIRVFNFMKVE